VLIHCLPKGQTLLRHEQGLTCSCLIVCRDVLLAICEDLANFSIIQGRGSEFGNNGLAAVGNLRES